ncbi:GNAT family N-acetyltransferase [Mesorhizobium sp. M4B.F.Ca.ET.215.01.1.1]|uniref:GNAT family N-acetyltransferase n=1 Tax=unclassified Mesorhizobium TaxID=325217 RepID=UPI000FCB8E15|nr:MULTISPECIES: GNAT family N-acetyltransferase [unclassified Mesorhizobium]RUW27869.1 GNAT family N-acetyltransferase [Mesorhizobium sp. M4B.F.Ca.ET.013.02.1.1]RVD44755.1 GNAT family N-acetyltransferase [Mesorhizobium sp. M4B.F.Ca.ET.019.03.1.1]RWX68492.1 GNAT family N-acetyltransferase [Mesorhizobium sp. M4B.F.Ca.ET.089.01.1.1]TGQ04658.1 GNAT family N-acetyltransferase [Mesorhizobium sp. M4B.F.Ca.ET.215.01.1.1]TGQ27837.1 GNAT family N-acetyltransferase [Mesorhizobium sp. M00.F.Ca.ET.220.01.
MNHVLDRPIWSALSSRHQAFAQGDSLAKRYRPSIVPFAATAADDTASLDALGRLIPPLESSIVVQADAIVLPAALSAISTASLVQMIAEQPVQAVSDERIQRLTQHDAAEMLALAVLTRPGPFTLEALSLGDFWGVKIDGRLAAMAGERMKQPGYTELSGVCSHPDFRGGGLARRLSLFVANQIMTRGEIPYLHAYASNVAAIGLYESIGFRLRSMMNMAVVQRTG